MNNKRVSIIVPAFNHEKYVAEALTSVLEQTYKFWECIIVDDGSTDRTNQIASQFCSLDNRFKLIQKKNGGSASARNTGFDHAKGEFIKFLDSDDVIERHIIEKQIAILKKNEHIMLTVSNYYSGYSLDNNDFNKGNIAWSNKISEDFVYDIFLRWDKNFSIHLHTVLFRKKLIETIKFDETTRAKEDWLFLAEVSLKAQNDIIYSNEKLAFYRKHPNNKIEKDPLNFNYYHTILFRLYDLIRETPYTDLFLERMKHDIIQINTYQKKRYLQIRNSKSYKIGKIILYPFQLLKYFISLSLPRRIKTSL